MSMAVSLELRAPFVDHQLVERAFAWSARFKASRSAIKPLLVRAADHPLVTEMARRPKVGFPVPIDAWVVGREPASLGLNGDRLGLDRAAVRGHLERGARGERVERAWTLAVLERWMAANRIRAR